MRGPVEPRCPSLEDKRGAGSAAARILAGRGGKRPGAASTEMPGHREFRGRPAHPWPRLTPAARSWAGAGRCRRTEGHKGSRSQRRSWRRPGSLRPRGSRAGEAGGFFLPACKTKRAWSGQVVTRRVDWRRSGPSQILGHESLGIPHPPPAPSPPRSPSGLLSRLLSSSGSGVVLRGSSPQS